MRNKATQVQLLITDATVISNITNSANRSGGNYTGSLVGLIENNYYYDTSSWYSYNYDGTTLYRVSTSTSASTSNTVLFDKNYVHGTTASPITGDITIDTTWAVLGAKAYIFHNDTSEPTITWVTGFTGRQYITWTDNLITIEYLSANDIIYSIQQIQ